MTSCTDPQHLRGLELLDALRESGMDQEQIESVVRQFALGTALRAFWDNPEGSWPWCEPFGCVARAAWSSVDGLEFGFSQVRVVDNVVQVRLYQECPARMQAGHPVQDCADCWTRPQEFTPSRAWRPLNSTLQIRMPEPVDAASGTCLLQVMRRTDPHELQPEAVWSASFTVDDTREWADVAPDVQIKKDGYIQGVLVRRAVRLVPTVEWAETPTYLPATDGEWASIVPDGSIELRLWMELEGKKFQVEARQKVGRQPLLTVEPHWGKSEDVPYGGTTTAYGYRIVVATKGEHRWSGASSDPKEVRVTDSHGNTSICKVNDKWVRVTRNLRVFMSWQRYAKIQYGTFEPPVPPVAWGPVHERRLDYNWVQLTDQLRVCLHDSTPGVEISQANADGTWRPAMQVRIGSSHELMCGVRLTLTTHRTAEFQLVVPATAAADE